MGFRGAWSPHTVSLFSTVLYSYVCSSVRKCEPNFFFVACIWKSVPLKCEPANRPNFHTSFIDAIDNKATAIKTREFGFFWLARKIARLASKTVSITSKQLNFYTFRRESKPKRKDPMWKIGATQNAQIKRRKLQWLMRIFLQPKLRWKTRTN